MEGTGGSGYRTEIECGGATVYPETIGERLGIEGKDSSGGHENSDISERFSSFSDLLSDSESGVSGCCRGRECQLKSQ